MKGNAGIRVNAGPIPPALVEQIEQWEQEKAVSARDSWDSLMASVLTVAGESGVDLAPYLPAITLAGFDHTTAKISVPLVIDGLPTIQMPFARVGDSDPRQWAADTAAKFTISNGVGGSHGYPSLRDALIGAYDLVQQAR